VQRVYLSGKGIFGDGVKTGVEMTNQKNSKAQAGIFLIILLVFAGYGYAADADVEERSQRLRVESIESIGNVTVSRAKIFSTIRSREGQLFDESQASEDAKRIAQIEGIEYAYYNTAIADGKVKLTFVVVERNLIRSVVFKGNEKFSEGKLANEIGLKKGDYLDVFVARNGVELLTKLYNKKGYLFAEVRLDEAKLKVGEVVYEISEGQMVKVKAVKFEGNDSISRKELKKVVKTKPRTFLFWPMKFNGEVVSEDATKLQNAYLKRGYLDVKVTGVSRFSKDKSKAYITFIVTEGPQYLVNSIKITGNTFFDTSALLGDMKLNENEYYSQEKGDYDRRGVLGQYLEQGFVNAHVEHKYLFTGTGRVTAEFNVTEGQRLRIGNIVIAGNEATHDKVVRRILDEEGFRPGEWFNAEIARGDGTGELEKRVQRSAMMESVFIEATGKRPGLRDAHVNAAEGQTGSIMLGVGAASDSGLVGQISLRQNNFDITDWPESSKEFITGKAFRGAGQQFNISFSPGTRQTTFSIGFTEPFLYDKPVSLDVGATGFERWRDSYDEERLKGYFGFEKRYDDDWRRGISFRAENVEVSDIDAGAPKEVIDDKGDNEMLGVKLYIRKETTDSKFSPSRGYHFNASYEQVGGDHTFGVVSGTQRWYKTLHEDLANRKTVLETKLHAATIVGDAPVFEKFYAGGTGSLRGFDYRGVSTRGISTLNPSIKEDPIGSDWIIVGNAEVSVPLTSEVLSALFFVDAGTIDSGGVRAAIGTGLQIMIPQWFGPVPMRFELATPIMKDGSDETRAFSFSVGALF